MKPLKFTHLTARAAILGLVALVHYIAGAADTGLLAHFRFAESPCNALNTESDCVAKDLVFVRDTSYPMGFASFGGRGSAVLSSDSYISGLTNWSIAMNLRHYPQSRSIAFIYSEGPNGANFTLGLTPEGRVLVGTWNVAYAAQGYWIIAESEIGLVPGLWYQVVVVAAADPHVTGRSMLSFFLNGVPAGGGHGQWIESIPRRRYSSVFGRVMWLSGLTDEVQEPFRGDLADFRVYDRALQMSDIAQLFQSAAPPRHPYTPRPLRAIATVVNGFVVGTTIVDGGFGYANPPPIAFVAGGGSGAVAQAWIDEFGSVTNITVIASGSGYQTAPTLIAPLPPDVRRPASGLAMVVGGEIVEVRLTDPGWGYTEPPAVIVVGGGGSGAKVLARVADGTVTALEVESRGSGYLSPPEVRIGSPPFSPTVAMRVSRVRLTFRVVLGRYYQVMESADARTWAVRGEAFLADNESIDQEVEVKNQVGYFKIMEIPRALIDD